MNPAARITLKALSALVLLVLMLTAGVLALLSSEGGSRWLLQQVPGLETEGFQGRLLGQWQAEQLIWKDEQTRLELRQAQMWLDTACLWQGALCLKQLSAQQLRLELSEIEDSSSQPPDDIQLPDVQLPLALRVKQLQLGALYLNDAPLLSALQLVAELDGSQLQLDELKLELQGYLLGLSGQLQMQADWPLELTLEATGDLPDLGPQQVHLELGGALQQRIQLQAALAGVVQGQLQGQAVPLLAALPATLELNLDALQLAGVLPEGLAINGLQLKAEGDMATGFAWQLQIPLAAQQHPFVLRGKGQAGLESALIEQLTLSDAEHGQLTLQATANWQAELQASAQIQANHFAWHWLAGMEQAPVALRDAQVSLDYADASWRGQLQAALSGPAGDFELASRFQGDAEQAVLEPVLLTAGSGRVQGRVQAGWAEEPTWQAQLEIDALDPAYWAADWPGQLAGQLRSTGRLGAMLELDAQLDLTGHLRQHPLRLALTAAGQGESWQVPQLDVRLGDNRIQGQLQLDKKLAGQLQLALNQPGQIVPGVSGSVLGKVELGGSLQQADARLDLKAHNLAYDGQRVRQLALTANLKQGRQAALKLVAQGLASGEERLGQLELTADGSLEQHRLQAALKGPVANASLQLNGALDAEKMHWQGTLQQLQLAADTQHWQLQQPLAIDYAHEHYARLAAHCLVSTQGRLCAEGRQQLLPDLQLDYRLSDLLLAGLQPWLPDDLQLEGRLNGQIRLQQQHNALRGHLQLDAGQGALQLQQSGQRFAWQQLRLDSELLPERVNSQLRLQGSQQGELLLEASLDPRPANKPLSGQFSLKGLQLEALHGFVPDFEQLQGLIEGQGRLSGTLLEPRIDGDIRLSQGEIGGGQLPVMLEQLQLAVRIDGQQARIEGGWRSGERGTASVHGALAWADELQAELQLKGQALPVFVPPYADLLVAPDLQVNYDAQGLAVTGVVAVPSGSIVIKELPADSVSVSSDAVVVGREPADDSVQVRMAVAVDVGSERLHFSGFGLTADVAGKLHIADNLTGRGVLELNKGRFRGYGQKLDLRRARLLFSGPLTQPYIDIEAVRVTGEVTAGLRVSGMAEQPQTQIFSEPPMAQEQAMSWLLLGKPLGGGDDGNMMAEAAVAMGLMGALPATQKLADSLGIRDFELDSEGSGNQTSVVASGQITERLSLRYGVGIFEPSSTLGLRYQLSKRLYLDAASGLANSLDLFYRKRF